MYVTYLRTREVVNDTDADYLDPWFTKYSIDLLERPGFTQNRVAEGNSNASHQLLQLNKKPATRLSENRTAEGTAR